MTTMDEGVTAYLQGFGTYDFQPPDIAGRYKGRNLIVCGDAACIWEDLESFNARCDDGKGKVYRPGWDIMTVNAAIITMPAEIEHCYSNERHLLDDFIKARRNEYVREFGGPLHIHSRNQGQKYYWPWSGHGTSGLGAVLTGLALGYDLIMLCGMPLSDGPHNGEPHWRDCNFRRECADSGNSGINQYWKRAREAAFRGRVRSASGRTKEWLSTSMPRLSNHL